MEEYDRLGGSQENILQLSMEKSGGYKTEVEERIETRERLARRNKLKEKEHLEVHGRFRTRYMDENVFTRPNGLRENLKLPFRVGDLDLPERKKKGTPVVEKRRKMH